MTRSIPIAVALLAALTGPACVTGSREDQREAEAAMEAAIAACRCQFHTDSEEYDIPCGTTLCVDRFPIQCDLDATVNLLDSECDSDDADRLVPGICITDYPGDYPIDCENIASLYECESYGGCFVQDAPCTEADFGCEGFVSDVDEE